MIKNIIIILSVVLITNIITAQNAPKMTFLGGHTQYLGDIEYKKIKKIEIKFKNDGDAVLVIKNIMLKNSETSNKFGSYVYNDFRVSFPYEPIFPGEISAIQIEIVPKVIGPLFTQKNDSIYSPLILHIKTNCTISEQNLSLDGKVIIGNKFHSITLNEMIQLHSSYCMNKDSLLQKIYEYKFEKNYANPINGSEAFTRFHTFSENKYFFKESAAFMYQHIGLFQFNDEDKFGFEKLKGEIQKKYKLLSTDSEFTKYTNSNKNIYISISNKCTYQQNKYYHYIIEIDNRE